MSLASKMLLAFPLMLPLAGAISPAPHLLRSEGTKSSPASQIEAASEVEEGAQFSQPARGTWPNCAPDVASDTITPANCPKPCNPYRDDFLQQCVAFCTGDEVPQAATGQPGNKSCKSCPPDGEPTKLYADHETHECVASCPAGKAPNEKNSCATCKPPFSYADHTNHRCTAKCPPGEVPDAMRGNDCTPCGAVFPYADHERHACVQQCGPGKVGILDLKECQACDAGKFADHKRHVCESTCPEDHPYMDALDCVMTCGEGKVPDPNKQGGNKAKICAYCPEGKFADHALHECSDSCPSGYSPDIEGTLDFKYKNDCKRCPPGKFADHSAKICTTTCPTGTTANAVDRNCD